VPLRKPTKETAISRGQGDLCFLRNVGGLTQNFVITYFGTIIYPLVSQQVHTTRKERYEFFLPGIVLIKFVETSVVDET
jgi:hypothetical protein